MKDRLAIHPKRWRLLNGKVRTRKNKMMTDKRKNVAGYSHARFSGRRLSEKKIPAVRKTVSRNIGYANNGNRLFTRYVCASAGGLSLLYQVN